MAKRTISFNDYEEPTWEEYTGPDPKVGTWHNAELKRVKFISGDTEADDQLMFIFEISEGDFQGWGRGRYADFEGEHKWRMHQILRALQGGKTTDVTVDWENDKQVEAWVKKQKPVKIKVGSYNDRINIDKVAPLLELAGGTAAKKEAELPGDVDAGDDDPMEDYTEEELKEMSVDDLVEVLKEEFEFSDEDLPKKPRRGGEAKYKELLVDAILEEQESDDEGDSPETDGTAVDPDPGDEEFQDGFDQDPEPEPAPTTRRRRGTTTTAAPEPTATRTRRSRR